MERKNELSKNRWLKLTIATDPALVEPIGDYLVGVIDAGVETGAPDEANYGIVTGYVQQANLTDEEVGSIVAQVTAYLAELAKVFAVPQPELSWTMIAEEDWGTSWKQHFKPFAIVDGLVIAPTWEEYQPAAGEMVIVMDPGMAFGTGHHATTCLSLQFLQQSLTGSKGRRVLDVGTGTGILGMAAVLFGADKVLGLDNDPEAVTAATENVRRNGLQDRMEVSLAPLAAVNGCYEIVVANIVHDVLIALADDLVRLTAAGGNLILSGILAGEQVDNIVRVFSGRGLVAVERAARQEWAALLFSNPPSAPEKKG
ncbi:MAG: ribosomal protein L11 methyltransferase [Desulfobacterales bacterium GWB2_56_26]|nr:MAG: ribosomal protein L11 methyltransferase [Desulfobacterales bacterium GWB2_56_26]